MCDAIQQVQLQQATSPQPNMGTPMTCPISGPPDQNNPWISALKDGKLVLSLPSSILGPSRDQQEIITRIEVKEKICKWDIYPISMGSACVVSTVGYSSKSPMYFVQSAFPMFILREHVSDE